MQDVLAAVESLAQDGSKQNGGGPALADLDLGFSFREVRIGVETALWTELCGLYAAEFTHHTMWT
jgi:hypothetical protein